MKFNEKLMKLRRAKGLSQEELGESLNVTRQTISKWELGQTTPEMDSLIEIGKLFGVSVDELTNDEMEINSINEYGIKNKEDEKNLKGFILVLVLFLVLVIFSFFASYHFIP